MSPAVTLAAHPIPLSLGLGYTDFPELIAQAFDIVAADSHEAGLLLAQHGWYSGIVEADYSEAQGVSACIVDCTKTGRRSPRAQDARQCRLGGRVAFPFARLPREGTQGDQLAGRAGDEQTEINARRSVVWALMSSGELKQIRAHTDAAFALAEAPRPVVAASEGFDNARLSVYEGDWHAARQMSDVGSKAQPRDPRALAMRALLEYEIGDVDAGGAFAARLQEAAESVSPPGPIAEHAFMAGAISLAAKNFRQR